MNGTVIVNSNGGGLDEFGQPIGNGNSGSAITTAGNGVLYAHDVQSVGGVNTPSMIKNYDAGNSESPLHTGSLAQPDPYQYLPPPTTATGVARIRGQGVATTSTASTRRGSPEKRYAPAETASVRGVNQTAYRSANR